MRQIKASHHLADTCKRRICDRTLHRWHSCSSWHTLPRRVQPRMLPTRTRHVTRESFPIVLGSTAPVTAGRTQTLTELALGSTPSGVTSAFARHTITTAAVAVTHVHAVLSVASQWAGLAAAWACEAWQALASANKVFKRMVSRQRLKCHIRVTKCLTTNKYMAAVDTHFPVM